MYRIAKCGPLARGPSAPPNPNSDLDLAIIGITPLGMDRMAAIRDTFSESELPWKLDLVDWASFRKSIERDKVMLQRAPSPGRATKYGMGE
jgi:predicted nucleotidyltransferase